jgi:hypothetical protein
LLRGRSPTRPAPRQKGEGDEVERAVACHPGTAPD